ncbi:hypothetical protein BCR37DRAFT_391818 [Protomyces lactucae-debilis]|uniref:Mitochondrial carrier domain-containing protein n=1 Tax=Protomyces lactucae-debilis TaxID=2754530 RepID=A0A1Y2FJT0_PROLT|nr:uncharacterized protein BCR37DRAFT_391818 [Protomyces lactucae-debilis]ORY84213.1 hypothetical protein BCR37DRAFT_391818 [Protomyces lactucae-debilis]
MTALADALGKRALSLDDPSPLVQTGAVLLSIFFVLVPLFFMYPLYVISIHTLVEKPANAATGAAQLDEEGAQNNAQSKHKFSNTRGASNEDDNDAFYADDRAALLQEDFAAEGEGSTIFVTASIRTAWDNLLKHCGKFGAFRALPALLCYTFISELLFAGLGGVRPTIQVARRMRSTDPKGCEYNFALAAYLVSVIVRLLLIPLDVVITRQIVSKPDNTNFVGLCKTVLTTFKPADFSPIIVPTLVSMLLSSGLDNLRAQLHFTLSSDPDSGWQALVGLLVNLLCISFYFFIAAIQALVYRSHMTIIARMPPASPLIRMPTSFAGIGQELLNLIQEERQISSFALGRFWRYFKIVFFAGLLTFVGVLLATLTLVFAGVIHNV